MRETRILFKVAANECEFHSASLLPAYTVFTWSNKVEIAISRKPFCKICQFILCREFS